MIEIRRTMAFRPRASFRPPRRSIDCREQLPLHELQLLAPAELRVLERRVEPEDERTAGLTQQHDDRGVILVGAAEAAVEEAGGRDGSIPSCAPPPVEGR